MGYIAVDLDGTLAYYKGYKGDEVIGKPIPLMLNKVKSWLKEGKDVRIFTARAHKKENILRIQEWLEEQGLPRLVVTNIKAPQMDEFWDDKAIQIIKNTGMTLREFNEEIANGR
jgi:hypothetical protein